MQIYDCGVNAPSIEGKGRYIWVGVGYGGIVADVAVRVGGVRVYWGRDVRAA